MALGTKDEPWQLSTAPGSSRYTMFLEGTELVCRVGSTTLTYRVRAIDDLHAWLTTQGDWVDLGVADELKNPARGTVEAWAEWNPTSSAAGTAFARARAIRDVPAPAPRAAGARRTHARCAKQPHASAVTPPKSCDPAEKL